MPNTASRLRTRFIGSIGLATTIVVGTSLALGGTASAKTATVHFYSKTLFVNMYQADGQPVTNQNVLPVVGEYYTSTDIDYPGNNKHHGSSSSGYDHLVCTFTSVTSAAGQTVCDAEVFYNGSLLYADHFPLAVSFSSAQVSRVPISGGTGQFKNAHGTIVSADIGSTNNSNFTIA
jgi:hypothetical protein